MVNEEKEKKTFELDDLLTTVEHSMGLDELLNDVMEKELALQYKAREEKKQLIIQELVESSKIYEKMPLHRLAVKFNEEMNEIYDLLEEIILKEEFVGSYISGNELIFNRVQKASELGQKPILIMKPAMKDGDETRVEPHRPGFARAPLKRRNAPFTFKVMTGVQASPVQQQGNPLTMHASMNPVNAQLQAKLTIQNNSMSALDHLTLKFFIQGEAALLRTRPLHDIVGEWHNEIVLSTMTPMSNRRISFFLLPARCGDIELHFHAQAQDAVGTFIDENCLVSITLERPTFTKAEKIDEDEFHRLVQRELLAKGIKSYGLPSPLSPVDAYLLMKETLVVNEFELVGEKLHEATDTFIGWYYARCALNDHQQGQFIVIAQVVAGKMELFAMATHDAQVTSGLVDLASQLRDALVDRNLVPPEGMLELYCISCGGTLSKLPEPGSLHDCPFCGSTMQF